MLQAEVKHQREGSARYVGGLMTQRAWRQLSLVCHLLSHGVQITADSELLCQCTTLSNTYTDILCQYRRVQQARS